MFLVRLISQGTISNYYSPTTLNNPLHQVRRPLGVIQPEPPDWLVQDGHAVPLARPPHPLPEVLAGVEVRAHCCDIFHHQEIGQA